MRGDTIKPLSHDYSGLWRYRIGDHRLVYQPVRSQKEILLVEFAARGSVY
jgi:mRNA-degrading endonuclease RelE of RelBE toxin-antitoxin system